MDLIDLIIEKFDGVLIDDYGWEHHKVDGKEYFLMPETDIQGIIEK